MRSLADVFRRGVRYYRTRGLLATLRKMTGLPGYGMWLRIYGRLSPQDRQAITAQVGQFARQPVISLLMTAERANARFLRRAIVSLQGQLYPHWELCIAASPADVRAAALLAAAAERDKRIRLSSGEAGPSSAAGEFVAMMGGEDELAPEALYLVALEANRDPDAAVIYSDADAVDARGRHHAPDFKPDWNQDLFLGRDFLSHLCAVRRSLMDAAGGRDGMADYELLLKVTEGLPAERIRHIPRVLYHRRTGSGSVAAGAAEQLDRAVADLLKRQGRAAEVMPLAYVPGGRRVRYRLPDVAPRVSIIIPTRDRVDLLRQCVDGLLRETDYPDVEIIIVDNDSAEAATLAYFDEVAKVGVRVVHYGGAFNYSAINNFAARQATGALIALLNNDVKVIHPDWLTEMVSQALRPDVGAVGAKLYFGNDTIQHAGVVIGMGGVAGHIHQFLPRRAGGNHHDLHLVHEVSCVTAACLVLRREVFEEVGGLDEGLPVAFNDVDFCLRIRRQGYRIVWTPFAELYHLESASRGSDLTPERLERSRREQQFMRDRWGESLLLDPFYNPNLTLESARGGLAFPPRVAKPWREPSASRGAGGA